MPQSDIGSATKRYENSSYTYEKIKYSEKYTIPRYRNLLYSTLWNNVDEKQQVCDYSHDSRYAVADYNEVARELCLVWLASVIHDER